MKQPTGAVMNTGMTLVMTVAECAVIEMTEVKYEFTPHTLGGFKLSITLENRILSYVIWADGSIGGYELKWTD